MIGCEPAASVDVVSVPAPAVREAVPMDAGPSKKVTVPVGVPEALETVAVKVTLCPGIAGFAEEVTTVVVAWPFTVCASAAEVLGSKVALP